MNTKIKKINDLLSQDMSKLDAEKRGLILADVMKLASEITEVVIQPTIVPVDVRKEKKSGIIT